MHKILQLSEKKELTQPKLKAYVQTKMKKKQQQSYHLVTANLTSSH